MYLIRYRSISGSKVKLMCSLVIFIVYKCVFNPIALRQSGQNPIDSIVLAILSVIGLNSLSDSCMQNLYSAPHNYHIIVELQWLEHLWNHENMFKTGII